VPVSRVGLIDPTRPRFNAFSAASMGVTGNNLGEESPDGVSSFFKITENRSGASRFHD
jgi:hypothetical protein